MSADKQHTTETNPVTVTPLAVEKIKEAMPKKEEKTYLRIGVEAADNCKGYTFAIGFTDQAVDTDLVLEFDGLPVVLNESSRPYVEGCTIDYQDKGGARGFVVHQPSQDHGCGCGSGGCCG